MFTKNFVKNLLISKEIIVQLRTLFQFCHSVQKKHCKKKILNSYAACAARLMRGCVIFPPGEGCQRVTAPPLQLQQLPRLLQQHGPALLPELLITLHVTEFIL